MVFVNISGNDVDKLGDLTPTNTEPNEQRSSPDVDDLGEFWDFLDSEIKPVMPLPSCPESQQLFQQHKEVCINIYFLLYFSIFILFFIWISK